MFEEYRQREHAANLSIHTLEPSRRFNYICYDGDDDYDYEESTIPLSNITSQIPSSIVITTSPLVLPIEDPEDSLIMGNEDLNTIPEKESEEFIKSSVEDLVPIPSKSEDTSRSDSECILPSCDYFSPIDILEEKAVTFSNPLFNSNDYFTSSDDESLFDEDVPKHNVKSYSNPLFKFDDEYISSDVNPLFDELLENIESKDSYDSNLDEPDLLVTLLSDANKDECFDSGGDDDEINILDCEDSYYDSKGDILYLESLLNDDLVHRDRPIPAMSVDTILEGFTDEPPLKKNDDLFNLEPKNDDWKNILYDAPINNLMSEDNIFEPEICVKNFSPTYYSINHQPLIIQQDLNLKLISDELMIEQRNELFKAMQSMFEEFRQQEQASNLSTHTSEPLKRFNSICYDDDDDDDDEERTIPLRDIISQLPPSIVITTSPPDLSTIPEKESDEFIKSSVEDLDPIRSESEDASGFDSECDLSSCENNSMGGNPTPSYDSEVESLSLSPIPYEDSDPLLEKTDILLFHFDNSLPEYETFSFDIEEKSSGSTTTHSDYSLPDYEAFYFDDDHLKEKSSGSTTTHSDFFLPEYDSFIFDLSIDPFPPTGRSVSHHEEFADELTHIISSPKYDCFYFDTKTDTGVLTILFEENISKDSTKEFTSPELNYFLLLLSDYDSTFSEEFSEIDLLVSFPSRNKDKVFDPGISKKTFSPTYVSLTF
nr:hypothetical protein [Tanacetum cinerariifolium]